MTVETQYNVVKVNELREITAAQGVDELVINDLDSSPLETKKITAENLALSIKDYILPIATEDVLGGVKIGNGLTINPITGVLSNDVLILDDLEDVIILNAEPGHVLRYNGVQWINQAEGGFTQIVAGEGLSGGGTEGVVTLHVNAGPGLSIKNDQVTVNVHKGLQILDDFIEIVLKPGLVISENAVTIVTGPGIVIDQGQVSVYPGPGLEFGGLDVRVALDNASGLYFNLGKVSINAGSGLKASGDNKLQVDAGHALEFDGNQLDASKATYNQEGVSKFAPLVDNIADLRGTPSYTDDQVNPQFLDNISLVPSGAVFFFAGRTVPAGYLFCDGQAVAVESYPYLFAAIGNTYNDGAEAAGFFRVPDLRDEFVRGATSTDAVAQPNVRDRIVGSKEAGRVEKHTHELDMGEISASVVTPGAFPTTSTSGFVWGFTMNNCTPPHRNNGDGTYSIDTVNGDHFFDFDNGQFRQNDIAQADAGDAVPFYEEPEIPPGCARVEFPVRIETTPSSIQDYPSEATAANDLNETRPRNMALLPCIKY